MFFLDLPWYERGIRGLMAFICQVMYSLIASLYNLFMNIANVNILSEEQVAPIYQRVTMLLTIIMVFYVTFQFVKFIVQPDEISDKEKGAGKIIYKMIIVVVLIAFVPRIFTGAFWIQKTVINNDLIGKIILGQANSDVSNFGNNFAANVFGMFYRFDPDPERGIAEDAECDGVECKQLVAMNLNILRERGELTYLTIGLNASQEVETDVKDETEEMALINFNYLMAIGVGALVAWMLLMYCIEAGTRWAQLIFLQIIAPIPIIGYLSPKKDGIFQKWLQQCFTTYVDLFIRFAIIYFILLICQVLTESFSEGPDSFLGLTNLGIGMKIFVYIALVLGLLLFAKKAPKMLEELFPKKGAASGSFGLSGKDKLKPLGKTLVGAKRAIGGAAGGLAGAAMGARTGRFFSGMAKGAKAGFEKKGGLIGNVRKGMGAVRADVEKDKDIKAAGGSYYGARFLGGHNESVSKRQDRRVSRLEDMTKKKKAVSDAIGDVKFRKQMDSIGSALTASGNTNAAKVWEAKKKEAEKIARNFADGKIDAATFESRMQAMVTNFNTSHGLTGTNAVTIDNADLEAGNTAKWSAVKTSLNDAKLAAKEIDGEKYIAPDGSEQTIKYDENTFADDIGDISDGASAAQVQLQTSAAYKKAHANAKGASNK